jgi:long-chain acyl-CoA synthetase
MLGLTVLQVYGLTETCAICTMDAPKEVAAGHVGRAIDGVEMRVAPDGEILVRGANVFRRYWDNDAATSVAFADGWFRTGDRGEVDESGRWRILGRVKDLLVPTSGHKVAPEPIEERLAALLPRAKNVVLLGDERPHLAAIVTGEVDTDDVEAAVELLNRELPHYAKVQGSLVSKDAFTVESGLLTPNGKIRRAAVQTRFAQEIDALYAREVART